MSEKKQIRAGVIGLGGRGYSMLKLVLTFSQVDVVAVCDLYEDRAEAGQKLVNECKGNMPDATTDAMEVLSRDDLDAVFLFTAWENHINLACIAMEKGIAVAMEVGGAYSIADCHKLVATQEKTKTPFMLLENCCFGEEELLVTAMARAGIFGEIVHCAGAYAHDLRSEIAHGKENRHYRLRNYMNRCAENYPTHELGPIAKLLGINRGNRILSVVSVASCAKGLNAYAAANPDTVDPAYATARFKQGDVVTTILTCAGGETITIRLDTTLPRHYNREFTVQGTKGLYEMGANMVYLDGMPEYFDTAATYREHLDNAKQYAAQYMPRVWREMTDEAREAGHGGMDGIEIAVFLDCLANGEEMPIDVYDCASWMAVTALSEQSIAAGGAPQLMPDFTAGQWLLRPMKDVIPFD